MYPLLFSLSEKIKGEGERIQKSEVTYLRVTWQVAPCQTWYRM